MEKSKDNLISVIQTLFKWKRPILILCGLVAIGSVVTSLFLPTYYKSTTSFYAANPDLAQPPSVGPMIKQRNYYGQSEDMDRILSIAESDEVASYLINKFNLYEHYEVDTSHVKASFFVRKKFYKAYKVIKNKYDAIELSVEDIDPKIAAAMANEARLKVEDVARSLAKQTQGEQVENYENRIKEKEQELTVLTDSLQAKRSKYNIYSSYAQSDILSELFEGAENGRASTEARLEVLQSYKSVPRDSLIKMEALLKSYERQIEMLDKRLTVFNEGMSEVRLLEEIQENARGQLGLDKETYKQIKGTYNSNFAVIFLLQEARVPVVKSRPKRSLIVIGAVFISLIIGMMGALLFDTYRDVEWRKIIAGK